MNYLEGNLAFPVCVKNVRTISSVKTNYNIFLDMKIKPRKFCISCGKEVTGRIKKCEECKIREKEHKCLLCDTMIIGREKKCPVCLAKEKEARRWKTCSICGTQFRLHDHQGGGNKVCQRCKDAKYMVAFKTIMLFFDEENPLNYLSLTEGIRNFSSIQRNLIQAITDYSEFKLSKIKFSGVPHNSQTWDHINAMTYFIENYLRDCILDPSKKNFPYFREYLLRYAVQFRVTPAQNMALAPFQAKGITPEQYINVVGPIEGKTIDESIEIIRTYFING